MNDKKFYLKANVVIEPLIDRWYAWSHLISPGTFAMNIVGRHLVIMDSFIYAPELHASAILNPKMRGGPFMDINAERVSDVVKLFKDTRQKRKDLIEFAAAVKDLDKLLLSEAKGFGMEYLYDKVPEILKGYVELFYDRNNNADFRFFESLLYKSKFYQKEAQSISLWITNNDERPFCLSTPRLDQESVLHLNIPFDHPGVDFIASLKKVPQTLDYILNYLGIDESDKTLFSSFLTDSPNKEYIRYKNDKARMRYFGHACILIETKDISILVDPLVSYYGNFTTIDRYTLEDLPDIIDYVVLTHNHQDHVLLETLLPLRKRIKTIIVPSSATGKLEDPDLELMLKTIGFENVVSIKEMEKIDFLDLSITAIPFMGEHSDLNILTKACFLVKIREFKLLFFADSRILQPHLYKHIQKEIGNVDVIFLGMECDGAPLTWLYGPLMAKKLTREQDSSRRLAGSDCKKGESLVEIFNPKEVYVYAMGQEPWIEFISSVKYTDESNPIIQSNELIKICREKGIVAERLFGEKEILYDYR